MKKRFLLSLTILLFAAAAMTAGCGSDMQATKPQMLRVGMDASYPPFGSQNQETKDYEGFDVDIIRAIAAEEGFVHTAEDLQGKALGVSIGSTGEEAARKIPGANVRVFNAINEAFLEVQNGGVDAVVNDIPTNEYYVSHAGGKHVRTAEVALTKEDLGIAVRKGNHALLAKIDDGLTKIKANGSFAEI